MSVTRWYSLADASRALMLRTTAVLDLVRIGKLAGQGTGADRQFLLDYDSKRVPRYKPVPHLGDTV